MMREVGIALLKSEVQDRRALERDHFGSIISKGLEYNNSVFSLVLDVKAALCSSLPFTSLPYLSFKCQRSY